MIALRAAKVATVAAIALVASLVTFGNLTDYNTNFVFVEHVLSMDTIYAFSKIKYRAITDPALHQAAYALIIATEAATAVLCWTGALALARRLLRRRGGVQSGQDLGRRRPDPRLPAVARGIHVDRRRMVRDVAVAAVERRTQRVPLCHDDYRRADLRGDPGSGARVARDGMSRGRIASSLSSYHFVIRRRLTIFDGRDNYP
jgi:hypothetical protein